MPVKHLDALSKVLFLPRNRFWKIAFIQAFTLVTTLNPQEGEDILLLKHIGIP